MDTQKEGGATVVFAATGAAAASLVLFLFLLLFFQWPFALSMVSLNQSGDFSLMGSPILFTCV